LLGCKLTLADIDTVITISSDTLDGLLVPVRGEIRGNVGRSYCHIRSSEAAVVVIESPAERLLLVDWRRREVRHVQGAFLM
jgi:hypothetical protein